MTLQEIFDTSVGQIINQGGLSKKANGMCAYRGENGMKCAVGALMDDEEADADDALDPRNGADIWMVAEVGLLKGFSDDDFEFMYILQEAHDSSDRVSVFENRAKRIASDIGLEWRFA